MSLSVASPTVCVWAPGKVNVLLRVGPVGGGGYHEIATIFQAVSLYEEVRASRADTVTVTFEGDDIDTSGLLVDDTNLAIRAARAVAAHTGVTEGVRLEIHKRVPIAGGMGGGSADAAATLIACDELWGTHIPKDDLYDIAATLGADVPFALSGGTAMGTGRGDLLSPVLSSGEFHWVLAVAEFGLSTSDIYRECDALRAQSGAEIPENLDIDKRVLQALRSGDPVQLAEVLHNDLQEAALHKAPGLRGILDLGQKHGALAGLVSGSGPTIAFLAEDKHAAIGVQVALSAARLNVIRVKAPVPGARVLS